MLARLNALAACLGRLPSPSANRPDGRKETAERRLAIVGGVGSLAINRPFSVTRYAERRVLPMAW